MFWRLSLVAANEIVSLVCHPLRIIWVAKSADVEPLLGRGFFERQTEWVSNKRL